MTIPMLFSGDETYNVGKDEDSPISPDYGPCANYSIVADLVLSGAGTAGGTLPVTGFWNNPGPFGMFQISGTLGGRNVAVLVSEA